MFSAADLPVSIPVFPLPKALLFPRAKLPLLIFEPCYLAMLDAVLKTEHRLIGMVQPTEKTDALHHIGCAGRVTSFSEIENGRYRITLTGVSRFRIREEPEGFTAYRVCDVSWDDFLSDLGAAEHDAKLDRTTLILLLKQYFKHQKMQTDWDILGDATDETLVNSVAMLCPFGVADKQALLEAPDLAERRIILETLLKFSMHGGSTRDKMQ